MKYRSRVDIFAQILEVANGNRVKISQIIHHSNIPYGLLKSYLSQLMANGLIEYQEGLRTYKTGHRGIFFLNKFNEMSELMTPPVSHRK